jgi:TonB family protein
MGGVPAALREMLQEALAMEPAERTRTVETLQDRLLSLAKRKDIKEGRPATTVEAEDTDGADDEAAATAAAAVAAAAQIGDEASDDAPVDTEEASTDAEVEATPAEDEPAEAAAPEGESDDEPGVQTDETILMAAPPSFEDTAAEESSDEAETEAPVAAEAPDEPEAAAPGAEAEDDQEPDAPAPAPDRSARRRPLTSRDKQKSGNRVPILAALLVVVVLASFGGYLVMNPGGEGDRFAYYKARGDSLFEQAEYAAAKTEYEQALSFQANETVAERVTELEDRLAEQQEQAYRAQLDEGDARYQRGDSLLQAGESTEALRFFAEANRAYMQAARLNPQEDSAAVARAEQASEAMNAASEEASGSGQVDQEELNEQLYTNYRQQGDVLLRQGDLAAAQRKFEEALEYRPGDPYARNRLDEIASRMSEAEAEEDFQRLIARASELCNQGQCAEAVDEYQSALEIKPGNQTAQQGLTRAQEAQRTAEAQSQRYQYFRGQGDTYLAQGNFDAAIASYESALEQRPDDEYAKVKINEARQALQAQQQQQTEAESSADQNLTDEGVYLVAEQPPRLIGGLAALHRKVRYPEEAYEQDVEGRVYVQFVVDEEGNVQDAEVMRGLGLGTDKEALRVIRQARFEPGTIDGEPVKVRHTLYIQYKK